MTDENEQSKLKSRSNPWFFSKAFSQHFKILDESISNRSQFSTEFTHSPMSQKSLNFTPERPQGKPEITIGP